MLVDSRHSQTIVSRKMCWAWKRNDVEAMTLSGEMCISSVEQIDLQVDGGTGELEALVAQKNTLGFDILISMDAIKAQGEVSISKEWCTFFASKLLHV